MTNKKINWPLNALGIFNDRQSNLINKLTKQHKSKERKFDTTASRISSEQSERIGSIILKMLDKKRTNKQIIKVIRRVSPEVTLLYRAIAQRINRTRKRLGIYNNDASGGLIEMAKQRLIDLHNTGRLPHEIAQITGDSLANVNAKIYKLGLVRHPNRYIVREQIIGEQINSNKTDKQIATELQLNIRTVKEYRRRIEARSANNVNQ
ncbi:MAG: response regulator transcription factor [Nitrosomonas sp.]|nr:response regulator transcription factor [Nitrosomonas sp.]